MAARGSPLDRCQLSPGSLPALLSCALPEHASTSPVCAFGLPDGGHNRWFRPVFVGVALVARMLHASRSHVACKLLGRSTTSRAVCQLVIFEQNMPESSQSDGRLLKRKYTLRPRNEILSLGVRSRWGVRLWGRVFGRARVIEGLFNKGERRGARGEGREARGSPPRYRCRHANKMSSVPFPAR